MEGLLGESLTIFQISRLLNILKWKVDGQSSKIKPFRDKTYQIQHEKTSNDNQ